jgi:hypothetical protein
MGKQRPKPGPETVAPESYDRMAERLVDRGLASPLILDKPHRRRPRQRDDDQGPADAA